MYGANEQTKKGPIIKKFIIDQKKKDTEIKKLYKKNEEDIDKIVDFSDIQKSDIYVNLIHYDTNLRKEDNFEYYRYFSTNLVGCYFPFDNFQIFKLFISRVNNSSYKPSYILIIPGKSSNDILKEFHNVSFITDIIIFCFDKKKYENLKENYNKIKLVANDFYDIIDFLKSKNFSKDDLNMDNHLPLTHLITYYCYKKGLFSIHRILAYFFQAYFYGFSKNYFEISKKFIEHSTLDENSKQKVIKVMQKLVDCENFTEECIKQYTTENICYIFNKALRNFEKYYLEMAHFIGPFYYGIYLYTINHPEKQITKKTILYRDIEIDRLDLYSYQFCENDIICFTSFSSTTINENLNFEPSKNAKIINDNLKDKSFAKMIITYNPTKEDSPQGVDVSNLSFYSGEKEFLLFPFTFLKINKVEIHSGNKDDRHLIHLTIINKGKLFEKGLNNKFAFKLVENGNKIIIDKDNTSNCIDNEKYYKMNFNYIDLEYLQSIKSIKNKDLDTNNNNPDSSINTIPIKNPINDQMNNPENNPLINQMNYPLFNPMNYPFYNPMYNPYINPMNNLFYNPMNNPFGNPINYPFYNQINNPFYNPMNNPFNYFYFYCMLLANQYQNIQNMMHNDV